MQSSSKQINRQRGVWLGLLCVAVLGIIFAAIFARQDKKHPTLSNTQASANVTITKSGFSPAVIKVSVGTRVIWTNGDVNPHQVAADPYPKDNSIPGFNSHVVLLPNDTFGFDFSRAGTYTYHDERNPLKFNGTVIVK